MRIIRTKRWQRAQRDERRCWTHIRAKLNNPAYVEAKRAYWRSILDKAGATVEDLHNRDVLEVGCGPSGVFLLLDQHVRRADYVCLDPLLETYRHLVPYLNDDRLSGVPLPLEDWTPESRFDWVIAINCTDHCRDPHAFLGKLRQCLREDGRAFIGVNTHVRAWTAAVWSRFSVLLEPHHPYHLTREGYAQLFTRHFQIERTVDIEDEVIAVNVATRDLGGPSVAPRGRAAARILRLAKPANLFYAVMRRMNLPAHDFDNVGNSIYRHKLFVLRKAGAALNTVAGGLRAQPEVCSLK